MMYLAERRRSYVMQILIFSAVGALVILFAFYAFRPAPFSYVFTGGGARFWFSLDGATPLLPQPSERTHRRSDAGGPAALRRGAPLPLLRQHRPAGHGAAALPAGHDADGLRNPGSGRCRSSSPSSAESSPTRSRPANARLFLVLTGGILLTQAMLCLTLPAGDRSA